MNTKILAYGLYAFSKYSAFSLKDVEEFLAGFMEGLIQQDDLALIEACLTGAEGLEKEMEVAFEDFSKGTVAGYVAGIQEVGKIVEELPQDLSTCQGMQPDITRIETWFKSINMTVVMKNVMKNVVTIEQDVQRLMNDVAADEMFYSGEDIANIMVLALGPVPPTPSQEDPETLMITQW